MEKIEKSDMFHMRMTPTMRKWIDKEAVKKDVSSAWLVRHIITQHIENDGGK